MTSPVTFYWPQQGDSGHSTCLSSWVALQPVEIVTEQGQSVLIPGGNVSGQQGLLLPRKDRATAYAYLYGASGLATIAVSGGVIGFGAAIEDTAGAVWLMSYYGDITYVPVGSGQTELVPNSASGDVFVDAAYCAGFPYFVAQSGDIFTVVSGAVTAVTPGFGARVSSLTTDGTSLYAVEPSTGNLATFTFASPTTGSVATNTIPLAIPQFASADASAIFAGYFTGSQHTAIGSQPVLYAPASGTVSVGHSILIPSINFTDTNEPSVGKCALSIYSSQSSTITVPANTPGVTGNGTTSVNVTAPFADCLTAAQNAVYHCQTSIGTDAVTFLLYDHTGANNQLFVLVHMVSGVAGDAVAVGGWADSAIVSGASGIAVNPSDTIIAAANTANNSVLVITGAEPDWSLTAVVSGTGAPMSCAWASAGEQLLVADETNAKVQVFDLQSGSLVPGQVLSVGAAGPLAVTLDGATAGLLEVSSNNLTILTNTLNVWSTGDVVSLVSGTCITSLSSTEFVAGAHGDVYFVSDSGGTWSISATVPVPWTVNALATDGTGNVFATGVSGSTGYLAALTPSGVKASSSWTGSGDAIFYEQAQIAVVDNTNSLIRMFSALDPTLTQQNSASSVGSAVHAFAATSPSVWLCANGGIYQRQFTAPFTLIPRRAGAISIYGRSAWNTTQLGVGHDPCALAWDVSGSVSVATVQNDLYSLDASANLLTSNVLSPLTASATGWNASLGVSKMLWWQGALWASSSQNEALMLVSGMVPTVNGAVAPSAPVGLVATSASANSFVLVWSAPFTGTPPFSYQLKYRLTGSGSFVDYGGATFAFTETVTGLTASTSYDFELTVTNLLGSATSSIYTVSTSSASTSPPSAPSGLTATAQTASSVALSWTASTGAAPINYQVQYRVHGTTAWNNFAGQIQTTSETATGLAFSTTYDFQVIASNTGGFAVSNIVQATTTGRAPNAPTSLTALAETGNSVTLNWQPSAGTATINYEMEYRLHGSGSFTVLPAQTATSGVVSGLVGSTTYDFEIFASNTYGNATSAILTVSTSASGTIWNPADVSGMTLTNSDLTATSNTTSHSGVRSSQSRISGKRYVEFTTTNNASTERLGLANSGWPENVVLGSDVSGVGIAPNGVVTLNGVSLGNGPAWVSGGTLDTALDFDGTQFWYRVNGGAWSNSAVSGVSGYQSVGTSGAGPVVSGPKTAELGKSTSITLTGTTVADTIWPHAGTIALNLLCTSGTLTITPSGTGSFISGTSNNSNNISYSDTDANIQSIIQSIVYNASSASGSDTVSVQVYDQQGKQTTMTVAVTVTGASDPVAGIGGFSFSVVSGAYFFAYADAASGDALTVNFNGASAAYAPPSGYSWWDGSTGSAPSAPGTPTVTNVSSTSLTMNWTASATGTTPINYQPQYQQSGSNSWVNVGSAVSGTSASVTGLSPSTTYNLRVLASNNYGLTAGASTSATTSASGGGGGGNLIGQTNGTQNTGATQPIISGPLTGSVMVTQRLAMGLSVTDTNWPHGGNDALVVSCVSGTAIIPTSATGTFTHGTNNSASFTYSDSDSNIQAAVAGLVYVAGATSGGDYLSFRVVDELGNASALNVSMTLAATSSGAPSAPTASVASDTASSVSLTWTQPRYGTSLTYTVQYRASGSTTWTAGASTSSLSATVNGLAAGTSYDFRVYVTNTIGVNYSNVVTVTTGVSSSLPGDPTGTVAKRIADLLERFGGNCFPNAQDGNTAGAYTAAMTANHVAAFQYLTAGTGMGLVNRVYVDDANPTAQAAFCTAVSQQIPASKWAVCGESGLQSSAQTVLDGCFNAGCLAYAEGINEPDNGSVHANAKPVPVATTLSFQQFEYNRYHPSGILIAAASVTDDNSNTYEQDYYGTSLTSMVQATTHWCGHDYPNSGSPSHDMFRRSTMIDSMGWGSLPGIISEFHPLMYNGTFASNSFDDVGAYWTACALLASDAYFATDALIWFSVFNYVNGGANVFPVDCGLFSNFDPAQPKSPAKVIHNFFKLCPDAATNRHTFQPSELNYSVSTTLTPWAGDGGVNAGGFQTALYQGSGGTFYLFVRNEQTTVNTSSTTPVTITFNSATMTSVVDYSLTNPITDTPTPIQTLSGVNSVVMQLTTEVRVLIITHP